MPKTVRYAILSFLLLNTANFLLRPIRDGIGIQLGASLLPYLFLCTLILMVILAVQFGYSSRRSALRHLPNPKPDGYENGNPTQVKFQLYQYEPKKHATDQCCAGRRSIAYFCLL